MQINQILHNTQALYLHPLATVAYKSKNPVINFSILSARQRSW